MRRATDLTLLIMLAALFIFHSPFTRWWTSLGLPWYSVFLLWLLVIVLVALNAYAGRQQSGD